jgi:hypothetical protein
MEESSWKPTPSPKETCKPETSFASLDRNILNADENWFMRQKKKKRSKRQ